MKRDAVIIVVAIAVIVAIVALRAGVFADDPAEVATESESSPSVESPAAEPSVLKRPGEAAESTGGILRRPDQSAPPTSVLKRPETDRGAASEQRPVRR